MESITTTAELAKALQALKTERHEIKPEEFRYVIYARKSTVESEEKQVRSLPDQVLVCQEFASQKSLKVVEIVQEAESAKEPDTRPKFRAMLDRLKAGKYDGIIAWHPDRLARNMKEAGEVIDLLDKSIIKDLKFPSFSFENTISGKMLLGITFVLSKQYSDQLSDNVTRGNKRSVIEGKLINKPKHGYYKDSNQYLRPDAINFLLIKNAFKMRLERKTMEDIATYLNQNGYQKSRKDGERRLYKVDKQKVEKFLRDPIYTGVLMYGRQVVNLMEVYDFQAMISVEDFLTINKLGNKNELLKFAQKFQRGDNIKANLMRGMVICDACGEEMHTGITKKKTKSSVTNYFYYRCDTSDCDRYGKSIRAKVIMQYIYNFLDKKPFSSHLSYDHYVTEMKRVAEDRYLEARKITQSLQVQQRDLEKNLQKTKEIFVSNETEDIKKHYRGDLKRLEANIKDIEDSIEKQKEHTAKTKGSILTYEEFHELMEKTRQSIRNIKNMGELDMICRKLYLNFTTNGKEVIKSTLAEPFDGFHAVNVPKGGR